jgi:DHA3 family macrolide efflux protein-like MFS transporter
MKNGHQESWRRPAVLFLTSQGLSLLGSSLVQYALMWYVTLRTGSGIMMTIYITAGFLPMFLAAPFAGVWADRYNRKKLIIIADAGIALATLVLAIVFFGGGESLAAVMAAAALRALGGAVQQPAAGAILPQFVPEDRLMRVNGVYGSIQSVIGLGAPVASGLLMSLTSMSLLFFVDVITAAIAIVILLFFVKVAPHTRSTEVQTTSHWEDLLEGFRYIRTHRYLIPFFVYIAFILILVTPAAFLTPLQSSRSYGGEVWRLTAIEVAFSLGMLAGSAILATWGGFKNRIWTMLLSTLIMALCTIALGFTPLFWIYIGIMGFFGIALAFHNTPSSVIIQEHVEQAYLGRVFSVYTMLFTSLMPLSMFLFGPLAEVVSIESILLITGGLMLLLAVLAPLNRTLLEAGRKPESPV